MKLIQTSTITDEQLKDTLSNVYLSINVEGNYEIKEVNPDPAPSFGIEVSADFKIDEEYEEGDYSNPPSSNPQLLNLMLFDVRVIDHDGEPVHITEQQRKTIEKDLINSYSLDY